jgi:hypothetical protein
LHKAAFWAIILARVLRGEVMRNFWVLLVCVLSTFGLNSFAKDHPWQDGKVVGMNRMIPDRGNYLIRGTDTTYTINNYANGTVVQWWLRLTLGGPVKFFSDGKNLHVIDGEGKERKCKILGQVTNTMMDELAAAEASKTSEQRAQEQAFRDAQALQNNAARNALILQQMKNRHDREAQKVQVEVKDCTKYPALCQ